MKSLPVGRSWRSGPVFLITFWLFTLPAAAHGNGPETGAALLATWPFGLDIVVPLVLAALVYGNGMRRRAHSEAVNWHRPLFFFAGLGALFLALQSPIDPIAERLFWVHQVQHFLLRMAAPMLLALAWPQGLLTAGLPRSLRRGLLAPTATNTWLGGVFAVLSKPAIVTFLFIAVLYLWQIPAIHDQALENEALHYLMHVSMLAAGLIFWWRIFDQRPAPKSTRHGVRLMMLWLVVLSNIALGAYTSFKNTVFYTAYGQGQGRPFGFTALGDEKLGGIIIWIPSSMMVLVAVLIVIHMLGRQEARDIARQPINARPTTGAALVAEARGRNQVLALGFAMFVTTVFASAVLVGVLELSQRSKTGPQPTASSIHEHIAVRR